MAANDKNVRRGIELYIDGKEVKNDIRSIEAEARRLSREIKGMARGSEEYNATARKLQEYNRVLRQHREEIRGVNREQRSVLGTAKDWMGKWGAMAGSAIAAITGVSMAYSRFRRQLREEEEAQANLQALTGLDDESIQWLTEQAQKLSSTMDETGLRVRQSASEILQAYMLVGSAKPELLQDQQALNAVTVEAMRLAEAAKMDLNEAVNAVTTSLNQYSAGADQAARFTNVLAAGSKYGAANVQSQAAAVVKAGVAASSANVSFEQLVGTIEMLGEKGIKAEEAGTALKRFFLELQTGADDTNPAIVGLDQSLTNLANKHLSMGELQKMFGDRAINVAKILIDNTEKVREYTAAVTDTNVAVEQAAINSDTSAAKMAQMRNEINLAGQSMAKELAPVMNLFVGLTAKIIRALPIVIRFVKEYGVEILTVSSYLLLMYTRTLLVGKTQAIWMGLTTAVKNLRNAFVLLNATMRANPFGLVAAAITGLIVVVERLYKRTKETYDLATRTKNLNKELDAEGLDPVEKAKRKYEEMAEWEKEARKKYNEVKDAYEAGANVGYGKEAREQALKEAKENLDKVHSMWSKAYDEWKKLSDKQREESAAPVVSDDTGDIGTVSSSPGKAEDKQKKVREAIERVDVEYNRRAAELKQQYLSGDIQTEQAYTDALSQIERERLDRKMEIAGLEEQQRVEFMNRLLDMELSMREKIDEMVAEKQNESVEEQLVSLRQGYERQQEVIAQAYEQGIIPTEERKLEYLRLLEQNYQNQRLELLSQINAKLMQEIDREREEEIRALQLRMYEGAISEEQYQEEVLSIRARYLQKKMELEDMSAEQLAQLNQERQEILLDEEQLVYDRRKEQMEEYAERMREMADEVGDAFTDLGESISDALWGNDRIKDVKEASKEFLKAALKTLERYIMIKQAEMMAQAIAESSTVIGAAVAAVKVAARMAAISAVFATARSAVDSFDEGGFTDEGRWDEPQGIVHSNEFVANRFAVANPNVRPVLNLIDAAQKSGSISNLSGEQIAAVATGRVSGPSTVPSVPGKSHQSIDLSPLMATLGRLERVMDEASDAYKRPSLAECYITGKHGIRENLDLYEMMEENASRKKY